MYIVKQTKDNYTKIITERKDTVHFSKLTLEVNFNNIMVTCTCSKSCEPYFVGETTSKTNLLSTVSSASLTLQSLRSSASTVWSSYITINRKQIYFDWGHKCLFKSGEYFQGQSTIPFNLQRHICAIKLWKFARQSHIILIWTTIMFLHSILFS